MTQKLINYSLYNGVAKIELADGGSNLLSPAMIKAVNLALDQAQSESRAVVLTGAGSVFSAGFDLNVMKSGPLPAFKMLMGGFATVTRLVKLPIPLVIASNGHAVAAGVFLLLAGDYRYAKDGDFKIVLNEVEIGIPMPYTALAIARYRLTSSAYERVINHSKVYSPLSAIEAGFLDEVIKPEALIRQAQEKAMSLAELNPRAFELTKLRARKQLIWAIRWAVITDFVDLLKQGVLQIFNRP